MRCCIPIPLAVLLLVAAPAAAHDDVVTLRGIDTQLSRDGSAVSLVLLRAEIERADRQWDEAEADLALAERMAPGTAALARCRAALALDRGRPEAALRALEGCADPELMRDPRTPWLEGEALRRLERYDEAAAVMDDALAREVGATAERYLARAGVAEHREAEGASGAIAVLERGLERTPGAWNLLSRLLELEIGLERYDSALARLDVVIRRAQRPETFLAQRGDVLARAGRGWEAREAWTLALAALESRPKQSAADRDLAAKLHASLTAPLVKEETP